jgi:hypothetical protein
MLNLIYSGLTRLLPQSSPMQVSHPWINEDSGWHSSSYELAHGLEVIEHLAPPPAVFADTLPAFQPAKA